jgi:hypothetical protein
LYNGSENFGKNGKILYHDEMKNLVKLSAKKPVCKGNLEGGVTKLFILFMWGQFFFCRGNPNKSKDFGILETK